MITVEVAFRPVEGLRKAPAPAPPDGARVLDGDVTLVDEAGAVVAVQVIAAQDLAARMVPLLRTVRWRDTNQGQRSQARLSGLYSAIKTFGYIPPVPLRKRYGCSRCHLDVERPDIAAVLAETDVRAAAVLERVAPDAYRRTEAAVLERGIPPAWKMGSGLWTSGIMNCNASLSYHRDAGNVKGAWSAMLGVRRHTQGGYLHMVDYDCWLTIPDGSLTFFDGGRTTHGVTPFALTHPGGYRYTCVWYARAGLAVCAPDPKDEPARAARQATLYAERKAKR